MDENIFFRQLTLNGKINLPNVDLRQNMRSASFAKFEFNPLSTMDVYIRLGYEIYRVGKMIKIKALPFLLGQNEYVFRI